MSGFDGIRRVFRLGIGGGDADREVERELAHHFQATMEELRAGGMSDSEALLEARRRFGDEKRWGRELKRMARGRDRTARLRQVVVAAASTVREAARTLVRAPLVAISVVVVMGLGLGVNASMFGVLDGLFLAAPPHIESPDGVKRVFVHLRRQVSGVEGINSSHPYPDYRDLSEMAVFKDVAAYSARELTVGHGAAAVRLPVTLATSTFFPLLGVQAAVGRLYGAEDDTFGSDPVVVLGHGYWQRAYGGDPAVVGEAIAVGDETYTVIGVAPPGFTGVDRERVDAWLPLHRAGLVEEGGTEWVDSRGWYWIQAIVRLRPDVAVEAAEAAATSIHRASRVEFEGYDPAARVELASLQLARTGVASRESRVVPWAMGVALMVLLLTCANVANLLLARAIRRRRETAVRLALGVGRGRLIATGVAESVLLALLGGAAAVTLAWWGDSVMRGVLVPNAGWEQGADMGRVVLFTVALATLAGLLTGLIPAWRSTRADTAATLRSGGRGNTQSRSMLRTGLLMFQAAVTVVLLVGSGLFVLSLRGARGVDLGIDPESVLLVHLEPEGGYPGGTAMTAIYRRAHDLVSAVPGVAGTAVTTVTPFRNSRGIGDDLRIPGVDSIPVTASGGAYIHAVSGGYFETVGLDLLRGRGLSREDDASTAPRVAVVNRTMADLVWPDGDALGACLLLRDAPCATVVGIVENHHRFDLDEPASMHYYVPLAQRPYDWPPSRLMVRSTAPAAIAPAVRATLDEGLTGVRMITTQPYREVMDPLYRSWQLGSGLFAAFGLLALVVAALGLYSVLAFEVAERRPELGVRAALGARRSSLVGIVLRDGLRVAVAGGVAGVAVAVYGASRAAPLLFDVSPREPLVLAGAIAVVLLVAAAASGIPAWRAARVAPAEALQSE